MAVAKRSREPPNAAEGPFLCLSTWPKLDGTGTWLPPSDSLLHDEGRAAHAPVSRLEVPKPPPPRLKDLVADAPIVLYAVS